MRNLIVFLMLVLTTTVCYAQMNPMRNEINNALGLNGITAKQFVIGIGTAPKDLPNAEELAIENAIAHVYTQVASNVRAIIHANKGTPFQDNVAEHYSTVAQMPIVAVELPGIVEVRLPPGRSSDDKNTYFVAAFDRAEIVNLYAKKAEELRQSINTTLAQNTLGNPTAAAKQYLDTYRHYEELKEAELIMVGTKYNSNPREAFDRLYAYTKAEGAQQETIDYLDTYFQNTAPVALNNPAGVAHLIVAQFEMQGASTPSRDRVQLDMFTYGVTEVPTNVSAVFVEAIEREMTKKWDTILKTNLISNPVHPYSTVHSLGFGRNVNSRLTGTYWERGNKITVRTTLRDVNTGEFQAVGIVRFNKNALSEHIRTDRYKPPDYERIANTLMIEAKGKIGESYRVAAYTSGPSPSSQGNPTTTAATTSDQTPHDGGTTTPVTTGGTTQIGGTTTPVTTGGTARVLHNTGFRVQLRTDKGFGAQTYAIGEKAEFHVNVNRAAYIRLLYKEDGKWSQLAEDQYVKPEQTTQWLKIPGDFEFAPPEGIGQLVVQAKTTKFEQITDFYYQDGYRYIGKQPPSDATFTAEKRNAELIAADFNAKGPINPHWETDIARADSILQGKGPIKTNWKPDMSVEPIHMDNATDTATASIYLTTIPRR